MKSKSSSLIVPSPKGPGLDVQPKSEDIRLVNIIVNNTGIICFILFQLSCPVHRKIRNGNKYSVFMCINEGFDFLILYFRTKFW